MIFAAGHAHTFRPAKAVFVILTAGRVTVDVRQRLTAAAPAVLTGGFRRKTVAAGLPAYTRAGTFHLNIRQIAQTLAVMGTGIYFTGEIGHTKNPFLSFSVACFCIAAHSRLPKECPILPGFIRKRQENR